MEMRKREKVPLKPGFGMLQWNMKCSKLPKPIELKQIPFSEVQKHNIREDCWTVIRGKVYDITQFLDYHPGGVDILIKPTVAGNDSTALFDKYHSFVNIDFLLEKFVIGTVVYDSNSTTNDTTTITNKTLIL
ncbi:hypothetical protein ABK040_005979 [Willaertia magna]